MMDGKRKARIGALEELGEMLDGMSMDRAKKHGSEFNKTMAVDEDKYAPEPGKEMLESEPVKEDFDGMSSDDLERIKAKLKELG